MQAARDFDTNQDVQVAGILCVFQDLDSAELRQKTRRSAGKMFLESDQIKRERGEKHFAPHILPFCIEHIPAGPLATAMLRQTEPCGP